MTPRIVVTDVAEPSVREVILAGLAGFNRPVLEPPNFRPLVVRLDDPATGHAVGGLWGRTGWQWLFVELLFVPEPLRRRGLGTGLMRAAEDAAAARGCRGVWLDTLDIQAPGFYRRLGYGVFGTLEDHPPGRRHYFMSKRLAPHGASA